MTLLHGAEVLHVMHDGKERRKRLGAVALLLLAACSHAPPSTGTLYRAPVPARFSIEQQRLGIDADGRARVLLVAHFFDKAGRPAVMLDGTDVDWRSPDARIQWQTRMRYGQPAAILSTTHDGPLRARVRLVTPKLGGLVRIYDDTRTWDTPRVAATALGPYAVRIGWFPAAPAVVTRAGLNAPLVGTRSSVLDSAVRPGHAYRYRVCRASGCTHVNVTTPRAPVRVANDVAHGTGMWLSFSTNPLDGDYAGAWNSAAIVAQAVRAHLRYVELRVAYGGYFEITPDVRPNVDAVIDGLAKHGIATIAWTVPRDTGIEDLLATTRGARYVSANGTPVAGVAIDLERGDLFMGSDPAALSRYVRLVRAALGPRYPIVATVEDPYFEHLTNATYPYAEIARYASVLQPMAYWRMMRPSPTTAAQVRRMLPLDIALLQRLAKRPIPISIGGQTSAQGPNGHTTPAEILASLRAVRSAGAIGECFFDWNGTLPDQWSAITASPDFPGTTSDRRRGSR